VCLGLKVKVRDQVFSMHGHGNAVSLTPILVNQTSIAASVGRAFSHVCVCVCLRSNRKTA